MIHGRELNCPYGLYKYVRVYRSEYGNGIPIRDGSKPPGAASKGDAETTPRAAVHPQKHGWRAAEGERRTIVVEYQPSDAILKYLGGMREALREATAQAYAAARVSSSGNLLPTPVELRRRVKPWFDARYDYARHHVNPLCRTAVALLRSYRKKHHTLAMPQVRRLAMRIDSELFRVAENKDGTVTVRLTLKPFTYEYITLTPSHKKWKEYSRGSLCELLLTDARLCITFALNPGAGKPLGARFVSPDLNFRSVDSTAYSGSRGLEPPHSGSLERIVQVQNDFSRRRRSIQLHVRNPKKRAAKLAETRGRQRNRVRDALHKLSTRIVGENPDTSFVFEDLKGIRKTGEKTASSRKLRTYLNRWPYRMFQNMIEYKSRCRTLYVSPWGTSSECPVCGGRLEHPAWAISRCKTCGVDYDRDRLASLAILQRGLRLCDQPFAVSACASWQQMRNEYLHTPGEPRTGGAGGTEHAANAPNRNADNFHVFPHF
jgi:putative transposase